MRDLDLLAYESADHHLRFVREALPPDAIERLAQEVVSRLAFRLPRQLPPDQKPHATDIDRLCRALISSEERAGDTIILNVRRGGASAQTIYLHYIAEAARQLGRMWQADEVTFVEVTLATSRLYRIIRGLRHVVDEVILSDSLSRQVLFVLVPEETHTLGIEIASDFFRKDGWDVELSVGETHDQITEKMEKARFQSIVFVAHAEAMIANLIALVISARITQPLAPIVVAGNIVGQIDSVDQLVGADAVMPDIETAVSTLRTLIDNPEARL